MTDRELCAAARRARAISYAPYSHFTVGAALLTENGKCFFGCNIENAAYTPTVCAERVAFFRAISEGERHFAAIAVCGGPEGQECAPIAPCGVCRQVMAEFCAPDFRVLSVLPDGEFLCRTFSDLFPDAFGPGNLENVLRNRP